MALTPPSSKTEGAIRLGCGAIAGFIAGAAFAAYMLDEIFGAASLVVIAGAAALFAFLAYRYGDKFWDRLLNWWHNP